MEIGEKKIKYSQIKIIFIVIIKTKMLERIKELISKTYKLEENRGLFFSLFDDKKNLIMSNGVLETDKTIWQLIDLLYHWLVEKYQNVKTIVVDVVTEYHEETDMQKIMWLSALENWVCIINNETKKSGIILPNTAWINSIKDALVAIKQKYQIAWNISIYVFKTSRISL